MKRDYSISMNNNNTNNPEDNNSFSCSSSSSSKMWAPPPPPPPQDADADADVDELFAMLGYKLKSSNMAEVALKIEQLEQAMSSVDNPHLEDSLVHHNPSDLSSWLQSMLSGLPNTDPPFHSSSSSSSSSITTVDSNFDSDLVAIPGHDALYPKRLKPSPPQEPTQPRPLLLIDSQENGIRLVHSLIACAEAVQNDNTSLAEALLKNIGYLAVSQPGAMRKVATYFAEALARRIYRIFPLNEVNEEAAFSDVLQMHFYESSPYLKFAHFTANQAILESIATRKRVHVIDFSIKQGMQWPPLLQALALRPGGPPSFRLTGIGPPSGDNTDHLQEVGWKLAQLAETINVEFEYRGFVANSLADLEAEMFGVREGEIVVLNSVFEMHRMLARPGAVEKVLGLVKELNPEIWTVVEQEANHNGSVFLDRFNESLHYYSTMFDSLESCGGGGEGGVVSDQDKVMSEVYLGRQICNVVACEGVDRVERHETLAQWRNRFGSAGFKPVHLGSNAYKQASMLLALFAGGNGYEVEENDGCLMLGWHTRPLIATSAWRLG